MLAKKRAKEEFILGDTHLTLSQQVNIHSSSTSTTTENELRSSLHPYCHNLLTAHKFVLGRIEIGYLFAKDWSLSRCR